MWRYGREKENVETLATTKYSSESVESVTDDKKDNTKLGDILEITKLGDIVSKFPGPASSRESLFTQQYSYGTTEEGMSVTEDPTQTPSPDTKA